MKQLEADLKASLADAAARVSEKADAAALASVRDSVALEAQGFDRQLAALSSGVARLDTRVRRVSLPAFLRDSNDASRCARVM